MKCSTATHRQSEVRAIYADPLVLRAHPVRRFEFEGNPASTIRANRGPRSVEISEAA